MISKRKKLILLSGNSKSTPFVGWTSGLIMDGLFTITVQGTGVVDWGDGSATETYDSPSADVTLTHDYTAFDGTITFTGSLTKISNATSGSNLHHDIGQLPSGLTYYINQGSNTTSGDIGQLPSGLTNYNNTGSNTTSGDIGQLPSSLTYYNNQGSNTTSGDIGQLPSEMTTYYNQGSNTTLGNIANLPSGLTYYRNTGSNTTSGDISSLPSELTYLYNTGQNTVSDYTQPHTFAKFTGFSSIPVSGGLDSTEMDNLLIDIEVGGMDSGTIDLRGTNAPRTAVSDTAVNALVARGVTVLTNS